MQPNTQYQTFLLENKNAGTQMRFATYQPISLMTIKTIFRN